MEENKWVGIILLLAYLFLLLPLNPVWAENQKSNRTYTDFKKRSPLGDKQMMKTRYKQQDELIPPNGYQFNLINTDAGKDAARIKPHTTYIKPSQHKTNKEKQLEVKKASSPKPPQTLIKKTTPQTVISPPATTLFSPGTRGRSKLNTMIRDLQNKNN